MLTTPVTRLFWVQTSSGPLQEREWVEGPDSVRHWTPGHDSSFHPLDLLLVPASGSSLWGSGRGCGAPPEGTQHPLTRQEGRYPRREDRRRGESVPEDLGEFPVTHFPDPSTTTGRSSSTACLPGRLDYYRKVFVDDSPAWPPWVTSEAVPRDRPQCGPPDVFPFQE